MTFSNTNVPLFCSHSVYTKHQDDMSMESRDRGIAFSFDPESIVKKLNKK